MPLLMIFSDLVSLYLAGLAAFQLRVAMGGIPNPDLYLPFIVLPLIFILIFAWRGLYRSVGLGVVNELSRLLVTNTLMFVILSSLSFLVKSPPVFSRLMFGFSWLFSCLTLPIMRRLFRYLFSRLNLWGAPAVVVCSEKAHLPFGNLESEWKEKTIRGLKPLLFVQNSISSMPKMIINTRNAYRVKFCLIYYQDLNEIESLHQKYKGLFERIIFLKIGSDGLDFSGLHISDLEGTMGLEFHQRLLNAESRVQKRALDMVLASLLLVLLSPFYLIMILIIILDSRGSAFYTQPRVGKNGKVFHMIKFRTMHLDAEQYLVKYLERNPAAKAEWDCYQKLSRDPRITRVGRFLRRTSLDELPQLFNVIAGQMSLVGPRPFTIDQIECYGDAYEHYIMVNPGMTGLWQVSGRNHTTFARRSELDLRYVKSWSVWLDIHILLRTIGVVITRDGAK